MPTMRFKHDVNAQEATQARKVNPNEVAPPKKPASPKLPAGGQQARTVEKKPDQAKPVVEAPHPIPVQQPPVPPKKAGVFARIGKLFGGSNAETEEQTVTAVPQEFRIRDAGGRVEQTPPPVVSVPSRETESVADRTHDDTSIALTPSAGAMAAETPGTSTQPDVEADSLLSDLDALLKSTDEPSLPEVPAKDAVGEPPLPTQEEANDDEADVLLSSLDALLTPSASSDPPAKTPRAAETPVSENALPVMQESKADTDADALLADLDALLSTGEQKVAEETKATSVVSQPEPDASSTDNDADALLADLDALLSSGEQDGAAAKTDAEAKGVSGDALPDADHDADSLLADLDKLLMGDKPSPHQDADSPVDEK